MRKTKAVERKTEGFNDAARCSKNKDMCPIHTLCLLNLIIKDELGQKLSHFLPVYLLKVNSCSCVFNIFPILKKFIGHTKNWDLEKFLGRAKK